jgi:transposase
LRSELYRITGIDWAQVNGIDVLTAQTVVTEAGADLAAFASEKHFTSWLGLCPAGPANEQSRGKILRRKTRKVVNRAATAFRNAATALLRSQSYSEHNTGDSAPAWERQKPLRPWLASWPAFITG